MSAEPPRKRTRSQITGNDLLREVSEEKLKKKIITEGQNGREVQEAPDHEQPKDTTKIKEKKKKQKDMQDASALKDTETDKPAQEDKAKKEKKKRKSKDQDVEAKQEQQTAEPKIKKEKKKRTKENQDKQIKQEEEKSKQKKEKKKHKQERKESREKSSSKKKKHKKDKKLQKDDQPKEEEEEEEKQKSLEKQSKSKSKKKKDVEQEEQQSDDNSEQNQQGGKSKKKDGRTQRRGRKPQYIKRKKMSIFERQQIINKKWRVKKRSGYLNKMSNRAWGELRAGPYRMATKPSKQQQRKIIDALLGDGPKDKKKPEQSRQSKDGSQIKIQDSKEPITENDLQKREEQSQEEQVQKTKTKKQKKKKRERQDSSSQQKPKSKSKPKKKGKKKKQDQSEQEKPKAFSKSKSKNKKSNDQDQVKKQAETKTKKKKPKNNSDDEEEQQAKIEQGAETKKSKKKRKDDSDQSDSSDSDSEEEKSKGKNSKKKIKKQGQVRKPRAKPNKQQQTEFTKQESQKIIDLFSMDGGNYPQMMKQLPGMRLKNVRLHLRKLFHRALDIITYQVQHVCGRKIKEWEQDEKVQIVRQLHRIRSSNRLLSEANVDFREKMTALMRSYNDQSYMETVNPGDIEALYRKIEAFVRGYNTINRSKRTTAASITQSKNKEKQGRYKFSKEVTRKPIISGGHLLSKSVKSEYKEQASVIDNEQKLRGLVSQEKLVEEWNREEEKTLCQLYVSNIEADQSICDKLKQKYGASLKWRDFQVLGRKIDQLIKFALIKLQNLTSRPYSRTQRKAQMDRKRNKMQQQLKKQGQQNLLEFYKNKLQTTSMFLYDNEIFQKEEKLEFKHRIFKNLSLLERQIFGHIESYKLKTALVRILIEQFPPEDQIEDAVKQAKKFTKWARVEQRKSNISSIKSIFIGERGDYRSQNDSNQDSIMADIEKVMISKPPDQVRQSMSYKEESLIDEKSELFGTGSQRGHQKMPIEIDNDEEVVSDFQQPPSVKSSLEMMQQAAPEQQQEYKNLQRLYATLNTNSQSSQK